MRLGVAARSVVNMAEPRPLLKVPGGREHLREALRQRSGT